MLTPADVRLVRALAVLVECLPPEKHAGHLAPRCTNLADRIETDLRQAGAWPTERHEDDTRSA